MAIKKYTAVIDNTITNAWLGNSTSRATGSNMGAADILEIYSIYQRAYTASADNKQVELSRALIKFPVTSIASDRSSGVIPASGSVSFYLKLYNAETSNTVPSNFTLTIKPVSQSWQEGSGLDTINYSDYTVGNTGSNWAQRQRNDNGTISDWAEAGGDYLTASNYNQVFESGLEDLEVDVTILMEEWLGSVYSNHGFGISLSASQECSSSYNLTGAATSFYTKRFFARGTQYFFKRPVIEARWNSSTKDDRGDFYYSSSLATAGQNLNTLYFYNYVRGKLQNIPSVETGLLRVALYSGSMNNTAPSGSALTLVQDNTYVTADSGIYATAGHVSTGIYSCSLAITGTARNKITDMFDVWYTGSMRFFTGSFKPRTFEGERISTRPTYYLNITNLKDKYRDKETARFNLYTREKNWSPTIYTKANTNIETKTIESASYRVYRVLDAYDAIPHGTGSDLHTVLSHDISGNYFDLDMSLLQPGYEYAIRFAFYDSALLDWVEQDQMFKFRVESYEY
jgi:hypothetical protein